MKNRWIRFARVVVWTLVVLLVAHTVLLVASSLALRRSERLLREAGRPLSPESVIPPPISGRENAAGYLHAAFALWQTLSTEPHPFLHDLRQAVGLGHDDATWELHAAESDALLTHATFLEGLALVERGLAMEQCRFAIDYDAGINLFTPHCMPLYFTSTALAGLARREIRRGNPEAAWNHHRNALRLIRLTKDEPTLFSLLTRMVQQHITFAEIRRTADQALTGDAMLDDVDRLLAEEDRFEDVVRVLDGERLLFLEAVYDEVGKGEVSLVEFHTREQRRLWYEPVLQRMIRYRPVWQAERAAARMLHHDEVELVEALMSGRILWRDAQVPTAPWYSVVAEKMATIHPNHLRKVISARAEARLTRLGLALMRHRAAHGGFPDSLADVSTRYLAAGMIDPFSGEPFLYRKTPDGVLVYSVGANGRDDQGDATELDHQPNDLVWILR